MDKLFIPVPTKKSDGEIHSDIADIFKTIQANGLDIRTVPTEKIIKTLEKQGFECLETVEGDPDPHTLVHTDTICIKGDYAIRVKEFSDIVTPQNQPREPECIGAITGLQTRRLITFAPPTQAQKDHWKMAFHHT